MKTGQTIAQLRVVAVGAHWRVAVGDGRSPPVEGTTTVPMPAWVPPRSAVRIAGSDGPFSAAENRFAAALAEQLAGSGRPWAHLQVLRGRAEASGEPLLVVVDTELAEPPWELLSLGDGPIEAAGAGVVFRWAAGPHSPRKASATGAVWVATDDPASATVAAAARTSLATAGLKEVDLDAGPSVLWLVAHGERGEHAIEVALSNRKAGPAAVSARLGEAVARATLVVVAVCHGGTSEVGRHDALVGALLAAGVPAVLATTRAVPTELLERLARGMAPAIARGEPLSRVVAAGRREVRAWAVPHPRSRWTAIRCSVASLDALGVVLRPVVWAPQGWPPSDSAVAVWLAAAHRDAVIRADGYVGVEHLLRALRREGGGGPIALAVRRAAVPWLVPYEAASAALLPQRKDPGPPGVSPRLHRLHVGLSPGFDVEVLATRLLVELGNEEDLVTSGRGQTLDSLALPDTPIATAFEVFGGPEDGRLLTLVDGDIIGRGGGDATVVLYENTRLTDRKLSRRHLTWEAGRLHSGRPLQILGSAGPKAEGVPLRHGDIVQVTSATRLRAVCKA